MLSADDRRCRSRLPPPAGPLRLLLITAAFALCVVVASTTAAVANSFTKVAQQQRLPLVEMVGGSINGDGDQAVPPAHFRLSSLAFLCRQQQATRSAHQFAKMCADLSGIVLVPSAAGDDGPQRPILIGPEGIGIGTKRKRHFWSGRIATLERQLLNRDSGIDKRATSSSEEAADWGIAAAKRAYDYIRFGRRSASVGQQQMKKSDSDARGTYDYIRFG